jgi:peptide/nickel transport system substrate-binding protein
MLNRSGDVSGALTRRSFVKGSLFAGAGTLAAGVLSGCSGDDTTSSDSDKEKLLRFGQSNAKKGLDMQISTDSKSSSVADNIVEPLLRFTEDNELVPCLLSEIPSVESDGLTYKCTLNEGVKFHDGSTLTSEDVKYTFERMFTPATGAKSTYMYDMIAGAQEMLAGTATELSGLTIQDDTHFTFTLTTPMATFTKNLGISYADIFPHEACAAAGSDWGTGTNIVGTGPYKIVSNDDTTEVVMERFDDYHGDTPKLDKLVIKYIDDLNTKMLNFKNGDIDYCDLDSTLLQQYQQDSDVKDLITQYMPLGVYFVNLNLSSDNLKDVRVRQALSLAINRQELIDTIIAGAGQAASGWLNPQVPGYDSSASAFEYDPDQAKSLLAEAGASDLTLSAKVRSQDQKVMVAVQGYWQAVGVTLNVETIDAGVWASDWSAGNLEITQLGWFPLYADADNHMYTYFYSENAAKKSSFYDNAEFDALVVKARQSTDEDERADLYKQADDILTRQDYATLPLYYPKYQFVAKDYVENAKVGNLIYHMMDIGIDTSKDDYTGEE